jgi:CheY-like chemotaxis protein
MLIRRKGISFGYELGTDESKTLGMEQAMNKDKYIVYVDDDEDDRFIFQQSFESVDDYRFVTVESGQELFRLLERMKDHGYPCLIVCDMNMPMQNGVDVLREIKKKPEYESIPIVMFTTSKNPQEESQCADLGAAVEVKPSDIAEFDEVAEMLLRHCRH